MKVDKLISKSLSKFSKNFSKPPKPSNHEKVGKKQGLIEGIDTYTVNGKRWEKI